MLGKATIYVLSTLQLILLCNAEYLVEYFRQCEPGSFVNTDAKVGDPEVIYGSDINFDAVDAPWSYTTPDGTSATFPYKDEYAASFKGSIDLTGLPSELPTNRPTVRRTAKNSYESAGLWPNV